MFFKFYFCRIFNITFFSFTLWHSWQDDFGSQSPLITSHTALVEGVALLCQNSLALQCVHAHLFTKISFFHTITTTVHNPPPTPSIPETQFRTVLMGCSTELKKVQQHYYQLHSENSFFIKQCGTIDTNTIWCELDSNGNSSGYYTDVESESGEHSPASGASKGAGHSWHSYDRIWEDEHVPDDGYDADDEHKDRHGTDGRDSEDKYDENN